jgi:preprotein translocase subunit SecB
MPQPHKEKTFQMTFDSLRFINIKFSINREFNGGDKIEVDARISSAHEFFEDKKELLVNLKVSLPKGKYPFFFSIESEGLFTFQESPEKNTLENLSTINCPAIMFPYLRELIADLTRRAGFPPLHLPPINFIELAKQANE